MRDVYILFFLAAQPKYVREFDVALARTRARRATDDERRDVRSAGVADWKTARRGNTERALTA